MKALTTPLALLLATATQASELQPLTFKISGDIQYSYDSAVGIDEINQSSRTDDTASRFMINPAVRYQASKTTLLSASYHRTLDRYQELSQYNLDVADTALAIEQKTPLGKLGYRFDHVAARLAGDDFLALHIHTVDWGKMLGRSYYWRVDYQQKTKRFATLAARDSTTDGVNSQLFVFFNHYQSSLMAGIGYDHERAADHQYTNQAMQYKISWNQRSEWMGKPAQLTLNARYRTQAYDKASMQADRQRTDRVYSAGVVYSREFTEQLSLSAEVEYSDRQSPLVSADYDQVVIRTGLTFNF